MQDEIIKLLMNNKLRSIVVKAVQDVYHYAVTIHDNPEDSLEEYLKENPAEDGWWEAWEMAETYADINQIEKAFYKYVFDKMKKPYIILPEEILSQFQTLAFPGGVVADDWVYVMETHNFEDLYDLFVITVRNELLKHHSSDVFPICDISNYKEEKSYLHGVVDTIVKLMDSKKELIDIAKESISFKEKNEDVLFEINGIKIKKWGVHAIKDRFSNKKHILNVYLDGTMSNKAHLQLSNDFSLLLKSQLTSLSLLYREYYKCNELPSINMEMIDNNWGLINVLLSTYWADTTSKKDSFKRRIRNAVQLLIESDSQQNHAIGIALSVAAIEALLGEKGAEISERVSTNVSVLLESDTKYRSQAVKFIKFIYNERSRILHGEMVENTSNIRLKARHLASAILFSIVSHIDTTTRMQASPETPRELLQQLYDARFTQGSPIAAESYNVNKYWRE